MKTRERLIDVKASSSLFLCVVTLSFQTKVVLVYLFLLPFILLAVFVFVSLC